MVRVLVKHGSLVKAQGGKQGITALHWAAHKEMEDIALFLIKNGADVTAQDCEGRTPLSMATPELATKMRGEEQKIRPPLNKTTSLYRHYSETSLIRLPFNKTTSLYRPLQ